MPPKKKSKRDAAKKAVDYTSYDNSTSRKKHDAKDFSFGSDLDSAHENIYSRKKNKETTYPPRLMVDFTSLDTATLQKYSSIFQIPTDSDFTKKELAAAVARHFDTSLEVDEDDSICLFMRRLRNGENPAKNSRKNKREKRDKERSKRKTAGTRKRQREEVDTEPIVDDDDDVKLYCICNRPSFGDMIACDGRNCPNPMQWYHLGCVGLASPESHPDIWLCPDCDPKTKSAESDRSKRVSRSRSPKQRK